jgi:hypothetical protein
MPTRIPRLLLAFVLLVAYSPARAAGQTAARRAQKGGSTVVFAVEKAASSVTMEPIVIFNRGVYAKPPVEESEAGVRSFVDEYFKPGRQYRLLFGGGDAGTLSVVKYLDPGCVGLVAEAGVKTQVRLGGEVRALATTSPTIGRQPGSRRAPTDFERTLAIEMARQAYSKNGVGTSLTNKMEVVNLTATDLDRDGKFELIGSFMIGKNAGEDAYTLFMIFEQEGDVPKAALTWYHHGGEGEYQDRRLVDQLDLDGDGIAEVIAEGHYYESNDYIIYKKQQGRWRSVYQGGGGGC